ncbi:MAG: EamA family transporter [Candidatus Omnitrophota bacterium]
MRSISVLLISVTFTSISQMILKKGLLHTGPIEKIGGKFLQTMMYPGVLLGIVFAILGWAAYVMALSNAELSFAYPIWSLTYVVVPLLSLFIFKESVSLLKISGLGCICVGVLLIALSIK